MNNLSLKQCVVRFLSVVAVLASTTALYPQQPTAVISGPQLSTVGDIIVLDASASEATHFAWLVDASRVEVPKNKSETDATKLAEQLRSLGFKVENPKEANEALSHLVLNDGKMLILASYKGDWRVVLAASNENGVVVRDWKVKVSNGSPPTDVPPDTNPPPPTGNDGVFGLEASSRDWKAAHVATEFHEQGARIADVIDFFVIQADKGAYPTLESAEQGLGMYLRAEQEAGRMSKEGWSKYGGMLQDAISAFKHLGRIKTPKDFSVALSEVAKGLR